MYRFIETELFGLVTKCLTMFNQGGGQLQTYNHHFEEADTTNIEPLGAVCISAIFILTVN